MKTGNLQEIVIRNSLKGMKFNEIDLLKTQFNEEQKTA